MFLELHDNVACQHAPIQDDNMLMLHLPAGGPTVEEKSGENQLC